LQVHPHFVGLGQDTLRSVSARQTTPQSNHKITWQPPIAFTSHAILCPTKITHPHWHGSASILIPTSSRGPRPRHLCSWHPSRHFTCRRTPQRLQSRILLTRIILHWSPAIATPVPRRILTYPHLRPLHLSRHHGTRRSHARHQFATTILALKRSLIAADPSHIRMHHRIQWAILMHINMLTLPHSIWISSNHHTAVELAFLLGELKDNTFDEPPAGFDCPGIKFQHLNKLPHALRWANKLRK
jgi:hypothetical protein